jgi:hypothetical protein
MCGEDVVLCEVEAIAEGVIDVGLCGEMDDGLNLVVFQEVFHEVSIGAIADDFGIIGSFANTIINIFAGGDSIQAIQINKTTMRIKRNDIIEEMAGNKAISSCN